MRSLLKIVFVSLAAMTLIPIAGLTWLYFDSSGLPDVQALMIYAPAVTTKITDDCLKSNVIAIPYESIGTNLRAALFASGLEENGTGVLSHVYHRLGQQAVPHPVPLSMQISRTMCFAPSKQLIRDFDELRFAVQLERNFTQRELFIIEANRLYFGQGKNGIEAASIDYFHKHSGELRIDEAAMLAGLILSPSRFSPTRHPDRALERRNIVIDSMLRDHLINESEANVAKSSPLAIKNN